MQNSVNDNIIDNFCDSIWIEKGLSKNTIESYASDLNQLSKWLSSKDKTMKAFTEIDINMFLAEKIKCPFIKDIRIINKVIKKSN